jgi:NADH-quinone oxidoreductase subunit I
MRGIRVSSIQKGVGGVDIPVMVAPRPVPLKPLTAVGQVAKSLAKGLGVTLHYLVRPSTVETQQYPENREELTMFERCRSQVAMVIDENDMHKCTACGLCQIACPNGSLTVVSRTGETTGKREIDHMLWRMDSCTFCNACVMSCAPKALEMRSNFEAAVFDRRLLVFDILPYAGPPAKDLAKVELQDDRDKLIDLRLPYEAEVPMRGVAMPGVAALGETKGKADE